MNDSRKTFFYTFLFGLFSIILPTSIGCIERPDAESCACTISTLVSYKISSFLFAVLFTIYWVLVLNLLWVVEQSHGGHKGLLWPVGVLTCVVGVLFATLQTLDKTLHYVLACSLFFLMMVLYIVVLEGIKNHHKDATWLHKAMNGAMLFLFALFIALLVSFYAGGFYVFEWSYVAVLFSYPIVFHSLVFEEMDECEKDKADGGAVAVNKENNLVGMLRF